MKTEKAHVSRVSAKASLSDRITQLGDKDCHKIFPVIIKADVHGSLEAISDALEKLVDDEVQVQQIHAGIGNVTESDIMLASASKAVIINFNTQPSKHLKELAVKENVDIRTYAVIYTLIDEIKSIVEGLLSPEERETILGVARIQQIFDLSKVGKIAGCIVTDGKLERSAKVRVMRNALVAYQGEIVQLKRFKEPVQDVVYGQECGIALPGDCQDMRAGDLIECYRVETIVRRL